jgi:sulfite reductase (ferredoxin)
MINAQTLVNFDEIERYEEAMRSFLAKEIDADRFQSIRLQQGVYGQRQEGVNMIRVKIPGGKFNPDQLDAIAGVLDRYARHDVVHITTRQDIQIHHVPLEDTPAALKDLAAAGLTTREACNNTVRNVTACPLASICPHEHVDITTHLDGAVAHFLRHPLTQHLPRKFKISFSGCEHDCAQGLMHDLAVVAINKNGKFGFKIMAGGGLGHKPREAIVVEEFIEEKDLLASMEAIITLHNKYSDRKKRAKSRIKFLVDRFGSDGFVEKYREEYARTKPALAKVDYPQGVWSAGATGNTAGPGAPRQLFAQKQAGLNVFPISIPIGDITAVQLRGIAAIMRTESLSDVRTTQDQNLTLVDVPDGRITAIRRGLDKLHLGEPQSGDDVVACPGTSTCRLGITSSKVIGAKLSGSATDLRIRASGCHNGCAQPETADIGIYGEGKRLHGKLIPHYQLYIGGDGRGGGSIGMKSSTIPAGRIETAISRIQQSYIDSRNNGETFFHWSRQKGKEYFAGLVADLTVVNAEELSDVLHDHGDETAFKVLQLGGGECAGAAQETVASNFAEAANERNYRNAFFMQRKYSEAIECATEIARRVGQSLTFLAGQKVENDLSVIAGQIEQSLSGHAELGKRLAGFVRNLQQLNENFDADIFTTFAKELDTWTVEAAAVCQEIDKQLDLSASIPAVSSTPREQTADIIDLTSYGCPLHYIKARNELRRFNDGAIIDFLFTAGEPAEQVSQSLSSDGHFILSREDNGTRTRIRVRKAG